MAAVFLQDITGSLHIMYFILWKYWATTCNHSQDSFPVLQRKVKSCGCQVQRASLEQGKGFDCSAVQVSVAFGQLNNHLYFVYPKISW